MSLSTITGSVDDHLDGDTAVYRDHKWIESLLEQSLQYIKITKTTAGLEFLLKWLEMIHLAGTTCRRPM